MREMTTYREVVWNNNPNGSLGRSHGEMHKRNLFSSFGGAVAGDRVVVADDDFVQKDELLNSLKRSRTWEFEYGTVFFQLKIVVTEDMGERGVALGF